MRGSITQGKACKHEMGTDRGSISHAWPLILLVWGRTGGSKDRHVKVQLQVFAAPALCSERFSVLLSFYHPKFCQSQGQNCQ